MREKTPLGSSEVSSETIHIQEHTNKVTGGPCSGLYGFVFRDPNGSINHITCRDCGSQQVLPEAPQPPK